MYNFNLKKIAEIINLLDICVGMIKEKSLKNNNLPFTIPICMN